VLVGTVGFEDVLAAVPAHHGLHVLPSGTVAPNATELVGGSAFGQLIEEL
jgi:hypothetical protein